MSELDGYGVLQDVLLHVQYHSNVFTNLQVLIEQLLRSQSIPPPAHLNHLHRQGSGLVDQLLLGRQPQDPRLFDTSSQHLSNREFEQLMLARQNHTSSPSFEQLIRQKQQEEQQQVWLCCSMIFVVHFQSCVLAM